MAHPAGCDPRWKLTLNTSLAARVKYPAYWLSIDWPMSDLSQRIIPSSAQGPKQQNQVAHFPRPPGGSHCPKYALGSRSSGQEAKTPYTVTLLSTGCIRLVVEENRGSMPYSLYNAL